MTIRVGFSLLVWLFGFSIVPNCPMADDTYIHAFDATLVSICVGPLAIHIWLNKHSPCTPSHSA